MFGQIVFTSISLLIILFSYPVMHKNDQSFCYLKCNLCFCVICSTYPKFYFGHGWINFKPYKLLNYFEPENCWKPNKVIFNFHTMCDMKDMLFYRLKEWSLNYLFYLPSWRQLLVRLLPKLFFFLSFCSVGPSISPVWGNVDPRFVTIFGR